MNVRITILVDNNAGDGLSAEHGLALWVETADTCILLDTGQGVALVPNAEKLGIDLSRSDLLVFSHGHYDHTGGVSRLIRTAPEMEVFCHPFAVVPRYGMRSGEVTSLGMTCESLWSLDRLSSGKIHWIQDGRILSPDIGLTGYIPRETLYEDTGGAFYLDPELSRPDPINDDLALWVNTPEGLIVCVGCCHAGLVNTLRKACLQSGTSRLRAVIGGFHLLNADDGRLNKTILDLQALAPELVVPCHCTGSRAIEALTEAFGTSVTAGCSGRTFEF